MLPWYPSGDSRGGHGFEVSSFWRKLVADYARLSLVDVGHLDYIQYLQWRRDAYIHRLEQTAEGQTYLENAWRMCQTDPDRSKLRDRVGAKERKPNGK